MPKPESVIGNRFRELRKLLLKTQVEMSEELEITQANMSQIESGKCLPNFSFQQRLAERFPEVNFNWILHGEGDPIRQYEMERIESKIKEELKKEYERKLAKMAKKLKKLEDDNSKLIGILSQLK